MLRVYVGASRYAGRFWLKAHQPETAVGAAAVGAVAIGAACPAPYALAALGLDLALLVAVLHPRVVR